MGWHVLEQHGLISHFGYLPASSYASPAQCPVLRSAMLPDWSDRSSGSGPVSPLSSYVFAVPSP
eukprot:1976306-Rhodomonas_salina.2